MYESVALSWRSIHNHGDLWYQHLTLRKKLFVDEMGWTLPHSDRVEWDQFDTDRTIYVITHAGGVVRAASRINPCNFETVSGSYMIRDAALGRLAGIPSSILDGAEPPTDSVTWEATRFTVETDLDKEERYEALAANAKAVAEAGKHAGATRLIALMPPFYIKWLTSIGLKTVRLGSTHKDETGERCCVMEMPLSF